MDKQTLYFLHSTSLPKIINDYKNEVFLKISIQASRIIIYDDYLCKHIKYCVGFLFLSTLLSVNNTITRTHCIILFHSLCIIKRRCAYTPGSKQILHSENKRLDFNQLVVENI